MTEQTRVLVRRLGKFRVADLAGPDVEAEQHAREHGEDVTLPQEIQDQRDMDSLEDSLENALSKKPEDSAQNTIQPKPYEELQECRKDLQALLKLCNIDISLE